MSALQAGFASVVITPPVGTKLEGYGGREGGSVGVHDDLYARALVLDDGATQTAIVSCDLIGIDRHTTAAVRELVETTTGIPASHVLVCATHTHAGPVGMHRRDDQTLRDVQNRSIAGAVEQAWRAKRPAVLKAGIGDVDSVSQNRRFPDGPVDTSLRVLLVDSFDDSEPPIAALLNFACHATVLFYTNMEIGRDYPGHVVRVVEQLTGAPAMFIQGACGDVNPTWIEQTQAEAARVGTIVGAEAARRILELRPLKRGLRVWNIRWDEVVDVAPAGLVIEPAIRVASKMVSVHLRRLSTPDSYNRRLEELEVQRRMTSRQADDARRNIMAQVTRLRGERATTELLRGPAELNVEVQVLHLGAACAILALPGEFFVETADAIRTAAGIEHLLVACYANHHVMYVPPQHEFDKGGYEPGVAILSEDAEASFRQASIDLVRELAAEQ